MPGRADEGQDRPGALVLLDAALLAQLAHRQVLGDALLDVVEARVVGVEHLARVHGVQTLFGALAPRHLGQPVEVGADHRALARGVAHALEAGELALGLLAHGLRHAGFLDLLAVVLGDGRRVLAELALDRLHLLAQEVLALLLVGARLDVLADALAHLQLGEPVALELQRALEALGDVEDLQQLDLLLEGQVGRVAGGVGERPRLGDRAQEGRDAAVVAAQLEDLLDHGAVLALELTGAPVDGDVVGALLDLHAQLALRVGLGGARDSAGDAFQRHGAATAGQADAVGDSRDGADRREVAVVARHQQHALLVADVDGQGDVHRREDDGVLEGDEKEGAGHAEPLVRGETLV